MEELKIPDWAMELKVYMVKHGLNNTKVSKLTGLAFATISDYTRGVKRPSIKSCNKIQDAIGFDMIEALYRSDKKEREEKKDGEREKKKD